VGKKVVFKGYLYEDEKNETNDVDFKFDSKGAEAVGAEVANQASQTGIQAVVATVQTQAANLGASGLIAVGSGATFQITHIQHHSNEFTEKAAPMIQELVETGTITPPEGHSQHGVEIPKTTSFFGVKVGEERNKSDEEKALEKAFIESSRPPQVGDKERQGSET
tara:strand:- start:184 stop:678 length:495 start_codon:yes stop_codon:yes gene_type:complete